MALSLHRILQFCMLQALVLPRYASAVYSLPSSRCATRGSFEIELADVFSESADFSRHACKVYISSTYNNTLVEYDPDQNTFHVIEIPGVSYDQEYLLSGVDASQYSENIYISANARAAFFTNGANLSGPDVLLRYVPGQKVTVLANLTGHILSLEKELGFDIGGFQDQAEDAAGNVYYLATWGNVLLRVDPTGRISTYYAPRRGSNDGRQAGFGGIFTLNSLLVVSDAISSSFLVFDLWSSHSHKPREVVPSGIPTGAPVLLCDSLYNPNRYEGRVALCAADFVDGVGGITVYQSTDGWQSARYVGILWNNATHIDGAVITATYEARGSIFGLVAYLPDNDGNLPQARSFPLLDITARIDAMLQQKPGP